MEVKSRSDTWGVPERTMIYYTFSHKNAKIEISEGSEGLSLDLFTNDGGEKGEGKMLLCMVLNWLTTNKPEYQKITLASVPYTHVYRKRGMTKANARISLNKYYTSLGFKKNKPEDPENRLFTGSISTLKEASCQSKGGLRKYNRKTRRNK
jgi:hypothetical protein